MALDTTAREPDGVSGRALLSGRLWAAMLTPIFLLLGAGALLAFQIERLNDHAQSVDHTDAVIATTYETMKGILDQETSLRGYLLAEDVAFLSPYRQANPTETLDQLYLLVVDNPVQQRRVRELRKSYLEWQQLASGVVDGKQLAEARSRAGMWSRKHHMDHIRAISRQLLEEEQVVRVQRARELAFAREVTQIGLIVLLTASALLIAFVSRRQLGAMAETYDAALRGERETRAVLADESWVRSSQVELASVVQGDLSLEELCARALKRLCALAEADVGAVYVGEGNKLRRVAGHALEAGDSREAFALGEGLLGQAAADNRFVHLTQVPSDYLRVRSATGHRASSQVLLIPASAEGRVHAMVELGFLQPVAPRVMALCERIGEVLAVAIRSAEYRSNLRAYLEETQRQAEELAVQQEELRVANEELAEQSNVLKETQQRMQLQQAELEQTNENLEHQTHQLEQQNDELRRAKQELVQTAAEVARANHYKSEFLANMSHELRTPLNSTLILAKLLSDNKEQNLSAEQVKFAHTIYAAGNDLLALINDVLDLSRIEAGKMEVHPAPITVARLIEPVQSTFEPIARQKGVTFTQHLEDVGSIETDVQRAQQILRNLLSNAFKFTERGEVELRVTAQGEQVVFRVRDTGIGIAEDKHDVVFEAFRQADGTTNRKYGGTGLGLSISRDLARLLGGELSLESALGQGSTFTLCLPRQLVQRAEEAPKPRLSPAPSGDGRVPPKPAIARSGNGRLPASAVADDREALASNRRLLLIVEDDPTFASILVDLGRELDFQCVVAENADEAVRVSQQHVPSAVILDIGLPDHSGLSVLDRLKRSPKTRHVPVHVVSASDHARAALSMGAVGYALKPIAREELARAVRTLKDKFPREARLVLVVEDDPVQRESVAMLLQGPGVETVAVDTVDAALSELRQRTFDCVVTDLSFPGASGYELLETLAGDDRYAFPPVIVYTGHALTVEEEQKLRRYSSSIIVKGARSPERLLDEVTLFLHQVEATLPPDRQRMLRAARDRESVFEGRTILLVEDDVRNVFALVSVLEPKGAKVEIARNGYEAIARLEQVETIDLVLMDVMMPEMDGLTAMREIRKRKEWQKLPIIALTAKAMRDDQEKCLSAGANDYVSKPFDVEMLLSLLRVWLSR
jgi:signal transduction histidine kinase/DNA-binding response OmpR family regulator/CHASE3 domain sensor protein